MVICVPFSNSSKDILNVSFEQVMEASYNKCMMTMAVMPKRIALEC